MPIYKAPIDDYKFIFKDVFSAESILTLPDYQEFSMDLLEQVLEEAAKFCENEIQPLNLFGDEEGCHFENGTVRTPKGFKEAYKIFSESGWASLSCDPEYGGQGLPHFMNFTLQEMICAANISFGMYPGLSHGAYDALLQHGTEELKKQYLPKLISGVWSGTMCLTEPQCGTDLGLIKTKAVPQNDGSYKITGTKIFISAGEHDLTENILHLVLARLPNAPEGIKGISLFLAPKYLLKEDGTPGLKNHVQCGSIEHKMGIRASATCVMNFDDAIGYLIGQPHKGMKAMFTMMNAARLAVGMQGLGLADVSYQNAVIYAKDRLQMRSLKGTAYPDKPADPIIVHPDVRRNLLTIKAFVEGARALACMVGMKIDESIKHPDPKTREAADDLVALLIPIIKGFLTDYGFLSTNLGVQVFGGYGYIHEYGMEQFVRDARISQIYEGTNGIQALDLVGRKLSQGAGRLLRRFFHPLQADLERWQEMPELVELMMPLVKALGKLQQATIHIAQKGMANPEEAGAAASDYLHLFGFVAIGYMWMKMAEAAVEGLKKGDTTGQKAFYETKIKTARFFMERMMPETNSLFAKIMSGAKPLMDFDISEF